MSTDEILKARFYGFSDEQWINLKEQFPYSEIPCAMETYATQVGVEFAKWAATNYRWSPIINHWVGNDNEHYTDDEVYDIYKTTMRLQSKQL